MSPLTPVVRGTALVLVRPCRFLRAGAGDRNGTAGRVMVRPCPAPPARRGYGYVAAHARRARYGSRAGTPMSVPARRCRRSERYGMSGDGTGEQMFCPRAHCFRKTAAGGSARGIAPSRPTKTAPSAIPKKPRRFCRLRAKRGLDGASMPRATITCGFPAQCAAKIVNSAERPCSPVRANWLQTRELSRAKRESERVWRVEV